MASRLTTLSHSVRPISISAKSPSTRLLRTRTAAVFPISSLRTMASAPARKFEFLVVVPDFPGAREKRLEIRPQHFANLGPLKESGKLQLGGAVLTEVPADDEPSSLQFAGSAMVVTATSKDEVVELLNQDVYAKHGVWDVGSAQIWPLKTAVRTAL